MIIAGSDFTSAPSRRNPIHAVLGSISQDSLHLQEHRSYDNVDAWAGDLASIGSIWLGVDFPLGQPRPFLESIGIDRYADLIRAAEGLSRGQWRDLCRWMPDGSARPRLGRQVDIQAQAGHAMNVVNPPVGMMFWHGAPALVRAGFHLPPMWAGYAADRVAVECYPALLAWRLCPSGRGKKALPYKGRGEQEEKLARRRNMLLGLLEGRLTEFGLSVSLDPALEQTAENDQGADVLDSIFCAIAAAWASRHVAKSNLGHVDILEGWICDPILINLRT